MAKRLLFLLVGALCLISFGMEARRPEQVSQERQKVRPTSSARSVQKRAVAGSLFDPTVYQPIRGEWKPGKEKWNNFRWSEETNDWVVSNYEEDVYRYNEDGLLIQRTSYYDGSEDSLIRNFEYGDNKCPVEIYSSTPYSDEYEEIVYDPIITNLVVKSIRLTEYHRGTSSIRGYEEVIERNDLNNIVHFSNYYIDGEKRIQKGACTITYKNGKAAEILLEKTVNGIDMGEEYRLTDIVWENTNGQIYDLSGYLWQPDEYPLYHGDNRLKHANWIEDGELYAVVDVEYKESGFTLKLDYGDGEIDLFSYSYGEFGGYDVIRMSSENNDGDIEIWSELWGEEYDRFGIQTLYYSGDYDVETEDITLKTVEYWDVAYNDEYGYPETVTCFRIENSGEPVIQSKTEYSDWINTSLSEVTLIEADEDAPIEYYTLDGLKVKNPTKGLYIRRQGSKTDKIYVNN